MEPSIASLLGTLIVTAVGAFLGALAQSHFSQRNAERAHRRKRRLEASAELIESLKVIEGMLWDTTLMDVAEWDAAIPAFFDAADDAAPVLPAGLGHSKRSVQYALGEALGIATLVSRRSAVRSGVSVAEPDEWREYAAEYVEGLLAQLREWRDTGDTSVSIWTYDEWLRETERHPAR